MPLGFSVLSKVGRTELQSRRRSGKSFVVAETRAPRSRQAGVAVEGLVLRGVVVCLEPPLLHHLDLTMQGNYQYWTS